jgi:acyl-CoA thioester hydrolase
MHLYAVRVHYEDTDFSGYIYHANYVKFCERGRSEFLRAAGVDQNAMFATGDVFVVRRMNCEFLRPGRFADELTVVSLPQSMAGARFNLVQKVMRGDEVLFTAEIMVAYIDRQGRPKRIPADMAQKLQSFETTLR